jgi:hypothetical protein
MHKRRRVGDRGVVVPRADCFGQRCTHGAVRTVPLSHSKLETVSPPRDVTAIPADDCPLERRPEGALSYLSLP